MMDVQQNVRDSLLLFVIDELLDGESIGADENLLADGVVDSLGMTRLVLFIEETRGITISPEDLTIENFRTIAAISDYLTSRAPLSGESI